MQKHWVNLLVIHIGSVSVQCILPVADYRGKIKPPPVRTAYTYKRLISVQVTMYSKRRVASPRAVSCSILERDSYNVIVIV